MKKKAFIVLAVLAVLAVIWCAMPCQLVGDSYQLDYIHYPGETIDYHEESANDRVDREEVEALLRTYKRSAVPRPISWGGDRRSITLTGGDGRRPLHILLSDGSGGGKPCYMIYTSADRGGYSIRDGEKLMEVLLEMLPET